MGEDLDSLFTLRDIVFRNISRKAQEFDEALLFSQSPRQYMLAVA
jgi:hypothetical protein